MYDKVANLSTKSLTETNSGKLITIISGDIFMVERAICILPIVPAAPIVTFLCLFFISYSTNVGYAAIILAIWIGCIVGQLICNRFTQKFKSLDALYSDQRMKLINDLVGGIRTIKSYAWENHYLKKIKEIRALQTVNIFKFNLVGSLGYTLFQNAGLVAVIAIFVPIWAKGELVNAQTAFSLLAMIFFLFFSITSMTLYAMSTITQMWVLCARLGDIFKMEEYKKNRVEKCERSEVCVEAKHASFSWGFRVKET